MRLYEIILPQLQQAHRDGKITDEMWQAAQAGLGPTSYVALMVIWLCTDAAAGVTGQVFNALGGKISLWSDYEEVRSIFSGDSPASPLKN
jgi:hypothetical protein